MNGNHEPPRLIEKTKRGRGRGGTGGRGTGVQGGAVCTTCLVCYYRMPDPCYDYYVTYKSSILFF